MPSCDHRTRLQRGQGGRFAYTTINPATAVGMAGRIGTLAPGADADLSLLRLAEGEWRFEDSHGNVEYGGTRLEPVSVVRAGKLYPCTPSVYVGGHGHAH